MIPELFMERGRLVNDQLEWQKKKKAVACTVTMQ